MLQGGGRQRRRRDQRGGSSIDPRACASPRPSPVAVGDGGGGGAQGTTPHKASHLEWHLRCGLVLRSRERRAAATTGAALLARSCCAGWRLQPEAPLLSEKASECGKATRPRQRASPGRLRGPRSQCDTERHNWSPLSAGPRPPCERSGRTGAKGCGRRKPLHPRSYIRGLAACHCVACSPLYEGHA
ncbi:hypothetical protein ACQJBY_030866 [Aegilops geniculata]